MAASPSLSSFASTPLPPDPPGPYQHVGLLLRTLGWMTVAGTALFFLYAMVLFLLLALHGTTFATDLGLPSSMGGAMALSYLFLAAALSLIGLSAALAYLYWVGTALHQWAARDPRAPDNVLALGLLTVFLSGAGLALVLALAGGPLLVLQVPSLALSVAACVLGVLLLVQRGKPGARSAFHPTASASPAAPST